MFPTFIFLKLVQSLNEYDINLILCFFIVFNKNGEYLPPPDVIIISLISLFLIVLSLKVLIYPSQIPLLFHSLVLQINLDGPINELDTITSFTNNCKFCIG